MNILTNKPFLNLVKISLFFIGISSVNAQNVSLSQDAKFEQLLNEKRNINSSLTVNNRYKIQIYNGNSENSKKILIDFKKEYKNYDGTIVFSTPAYKVWVGNFKTRIEAEKSLSDLKSKFPAAIIIKPSK
ncbi:SPOR domain-containing protein [Flavobacterium sp. SUN046]|uniref:SPOR domain-containing protein n=1 Tax=Flavobacterium sp. SUN046 TaxID=3002440 RepID=UPI002DBAD25D|nr:SPOR domain-containing protein [Flavobacterium sp. SUN046]MEC4050246.1 SPOR domain-containing protein [Flavobacterium sp. SUN046]